MKVNEIRKLAKEIRTGSCKLGYDEAVAVFAEMNDYVNSEVADGWTGRTKAAVESDMNDIGGYVEAMKPAVEMPAEEERIEATEDAFASDIAVWCEGTGNKLLRLEVGPEGIEALIEKADVPTQTTATVRNDKTFVVFSGDLDKTIAAFIMANGAAAMGRKVTMFFTFWGLNILRRPEKVSVVKSFIERMFGLMMPRGTKKLGLSRMNMGGLGAKMIRGIMKEKGVSSLEDLIDSARAHGVRLVACQMSMDIMGIKKEELIDGVELGGVSTFLGSGEQSDMSLFI